jgi:hypothetical protein
MKEGLIPVIERPFYIRFPESVDDGFQHYFCGPQSIAGAICPNCTKPLLCFFRIDTRDERLRPLSGVPSLPLLFCWRCNLAQARFFYAVGSDSVQLLKYRRGMQPSSFPYPDYPNFFEGVSAELVPIPDDVQAMIRHLNRGEIDQSQEPVRELAIPRHQLGGEPYLLQKHWPTVTCPRCIQSMPFLATIGDQATDPRGFTGNQYVQVIYHYCRTCRCIGAYQQCD